METDLQSPDTTLTILLPPARPKRPEERAHPPLPVDKFPPGKLLPAGAVQLYQASGCGGVVPAREPGSQLSCDNGRGRDRRLWLHPQRPRLLGGEGFSRSLRRLRSGLDSRPGALEVSNTLGEAAPLAVCAVSGWDWDPDPGKPAFPGSF